LLTFEGLTQADGSTPLEPRNRNTSMASLNIFYHNLTGRISGKLEIRCSITAG